VYVLPYYIVGLSYTIVSTITAGFLITTTVRGFMRHQREAYFYAAAWACLLLGTFAFALLNLGFLPLNPFTEKSLQIGSLFEVLILSLALADRLNQLRIGLKTANNSLAYQIEHVEEQVQHKTRDIRSIMEHIPLGVFSIAADQSIHKDYSRSMKELFHRENIAGENAMTVLFENAVVSADEKDRIKATLLHVLGEDLLNFEINRPSLPESMILDWQEQRHTYNLTWNPVCNDRNQVDKILVTVHDSTRLLTLEKEAETQRRKLAMIQKILDVPPVRFHSFLRQADHLLEDCRTILEESSEHAPELHLVLMNIHTLKGTARSLSFDEISELCHEAEECSRSGNIPALRGYISDLRQLVERYRSIEAEKFGRGRATGENLRLELEVLQGLIQDLRQGTQHHLRTLEMALYRPLEEVLQHGMQSAARLADELGKMRPEIRIEAAGYGLSQEGYDALSGIFIHIVRNSLDHGLETANERIAKGKPASGCMEIQVSSDGKQCFLDFTDDGRGLDLALLARKGRALGLLPENPGPQDVAELIFVPEFSTRDNVSKISGRGVGLSAVRETLKRHGGDVYLIMDDAASPFRRFHLRLKLPLSYWIRYHEEAYRRSA
jgi:HPt (histidine-containing phosphotransfer) domain-containing protein